MWISFVSRLDVRFAQKVPSNIIGLAAIFYQFYIWNLFCTSQVKSSTSISFMAEISNPTFWWMLLIESPLKWLRISDFRTVCVCVEKCISETYVSLYFLLFFLISLKMLISWMFRLSLLLFAVLVVNIISFIYSSLGFKVIKAHNKPNIIERTQTRCYTCSKLYNIMKVIFCP